jgi:predicted RNase H-like nuclease (RuvC/YqgF family)
MRHMPLFNKRSSMFEVQNRALIKTAKERAERIDKLERELQILRDRAEQTDKADRELQTLRETVEHQTDKLRGELQAFREGVEQASKVELELQQARSEIERLTLERDFYSKRCAKAGENVTQKICSQPLTHGGRSNCYDRMMRRQKFKRTFAPVATSRHVVLPSSWQDRYTDGSLFEELRF